MWVLAGVPNLCGRGPAPDVLATDGAQYSFPGLPPAVQPHRVQELLKHFPQNRVFVPIRQQHCPSRVALGLIAEAGVAPRLQVGPTSQIDGCRAFNLI